MNVSCPQCGKQLRLGEKIQKNIEKLEPGRKLKIKCVSCAVTFAIDGRSAGGALSPHEDVQPSSGKKGGQNIRIRPPGPPDVEWLKEGVFDEQDVVEDIPRALVLLPDIPGKEIVMKAGAEFGYRVETADNAQHAIEKMRFVNYAAVFLHSRYEADGIRSGVFHDYMRAMSMSRRRYIFYVLIGEQFQTLYDLQALACSANLVINEEDAPYIGTVLRKAIPEYEALFAPLMEELRVSGK